MKLTIARIKQGIDDFPAHALWYMHIRMILTCDNLIVVIKIRLMMAMKFIEIAWGTFLYAT